MFNKQPLAPKQGDRIYRCERYANTNEFGISIATVTEVRQTYTPKGKPRAPIYILRGENFSRSGKIEFEENNLDGWFARATEAVTYALRMFFTDKTYEPYETAEARLLRAVFGDDSDARTPVIASHEIPQVIEDLKSIHSAITKAFEIDNKKLLEE